MSRAALTYNEVRQHRTFEGFDVDKPVAGTYGMRLVSGGHPVAVKIWHGPPHDPVTGDEMDRGWRWQATANGRPIDLERVWPKCAENPISGYEAEYLTKLQDWGEQHAPDGPQANPHKPIDLLTAPLPW